MSDNNDTQELTSDQVKRLYKRLISRLARIYCEDFQKTFLNDSKVPDTQRGSISITKQEFIYPSTLKPKQDEGTSKFYDKKCDSGLQKSIVLLIESPHKSEYVQKNYKNRELMPIYPAQSETGDNIDKFLTKALHIILKQNRVNMSPNCENTQDLIRDIKPECPLVICNAIQYQTSLDFARSSIKRGIKLDETIRDNMFELLWEIKAIQDDLLKRLRSYNPVWIIDAVTGLELEKDGKIVENNGLNQLVYGFLINNFKETPISRCYHPAYWNNWKRLGGADKNTNKIVGYDNPSKT
ncbi:MAG: hypothetical protein RRY12_01480 [Cloacibacillus sp.]